MKQRDARKSQPKGVQPIDGPWLRWINQYVAVNRYTGIADFCLYSVGNAVGGNLDIDTARSLQAGTMSVAALCLLHKQPELALLISMFAMGIEAKFQMANLREVITTPMNTTA